MKQRKAIKVNLGNKYKATFQIIEWECPRCGHNNEEHQRIDEYDELYDPLMYACGLCGNYHFIEKGILK